ncbi:class I SAM-dependent methyltransferase [Clostridium cellulovorans]|uniref:Methyltransferase type 11 n=1 Tax=Clostridium cellulovorans (strain ATCC 35296 / DSM 3052 / OCM 3 / 743B) TaxID=573061 RepID=D9SV34_CLOC7|nr:class I SAM-dependent methyltransferase [Clostridium cellulovorans]ADL53008.1 Methyltransferase type 11 [Clostridium cellulovorans 743B]
MYIFNGEHYDNFFQETEDISMYKKFASKYGREVLEIGIGTGRIAIELAKEGNKVMGIDFSKAMIDIGKKKAKNEKVDIEFIKADMRDFCVDKKFDLIIIQINTITHLLTLDDIEKFFNCVKKHLKDSGRFIIDFFNPIIEYLPKEFGDEFIFNKYKVSGNQETIEVYARTKYHRETQVTEHRLSYRIGDREISNEVLDMRIYFPQELEGYLKFNGFQVEEKYGTYDMKKFYAESPRQIIVSKL